jgi:hypothetical protein
MTDRQQLRNEVLALNLPEIVTSVFDGVGIPEELSYRCDSPFHSLSDQSGLPVTFLPLWECGVVAVGYDRVSGQYLKISMEEPSEPRFIAAAFEHVVADLMIDLWEDEVPDERLVEVASLFGFDRIRNLIEDLERGHDGDYDAWRATLRTN